MSMILILSLVKHLRLLTLRLAGHSSVAQSMASTLPGCSSRDTTWRSRSLLEYYMERRLMLLSGLHQALVILHARESCLLFPLFRARPYPKICEARLV